ncbi:MAG: complex I subunit 4 family protein [Dermatophilaceae bacterium]
MALTMLLVVPAVTGLWLVTAGRRITVRWSRWLTAAASGVTLVLAVVTVLTRPEVDVVWLPELGVRASFGVDGVSVPLVLLTTVVGGLLAAHAWVDLPTGGAPAVFLGCGLLVQAGALATFTTRDAVMFFLAFEVVLVPMWVLVTRFGQRGTTPACVPASARAPAPARVPASADDARVHTDVDTRARTDAGARFILYTAAGSTTMLLGILVLVTSAGTTDLRELAAGAGAAMSPSRQVLVAALLCLGLAVKVPVFPLHTWLPSAHTVAPTAGSVLLAAVLLKMGTYGVVRLPAAVVPEGFAQVAPVLGVAGAVGVLWGGLVCLVERDLKRLIAYSSVAHMGFVVLALAAGTDTGVQAALFANVAHGVISALLFLLVGGLKKRWGSVDLTVRHPVLRETSPRLGFVLILGLAAGLGLPGLAGFWGEWLALYAAWAPAGDRPRGVFVACAVVAAVGAALAAAYALRVARLVWVGDEPGPGAAPTPDARGVEWVVLAVLAAAVVALGVLPMMLLSVTAAASGTIGVTP